MSSLEATMATGPTKGVLVNSLPKAGTNLVAKALDLFGFHQRGRLDAGLVLRRTTLARLRRLLLCPVAPGYMVGIDTPIELPSWYVHYRLRRAVPGTYCTAHVGYTVGILEAARALELTCVLVLRDPRAVLNSFVNYARSRPGHLLRPSFAKLSVEEQYVMALRGGWIGRAFLQPLRIRCLALAAWLTADSVLRLRFEDLVGENGGGSAEAQVEALQRLAVHVGAEVSSVERVAEQLFGPGRHTYRTGQVDAWRAEIPPSVLPFVNAEVGEIAEEWGYVL